MVRREIEGKKLIRLVERVLVRGPGGEESVRAKVDTGADRTTVDRRLANRLSFGPPVTKVMTKASAAREPVQRPVVLATIVVAGKPFRIRVGVTDRSRMRYPVIVGRDILRSGYFLIDPTRRPKQPRAAA